MPHYFQWDLAVQHIITRLIIIQNILEFCTFCATAVKRLRRVSGELKSAPSGWSWELQRAERIPESLQLRPEISCSPNTLINNGYRFCSIFKNVFKL